MLRGKWTFRANGRQVVFIKKVNEKASHVLMKAFLWALYLPEYPKLSVEVPIGDRYKPDLVQTDFQGDPVFWGESGFVGAEKIRNLLRRYPRTHFAVAKWNLRLESFAGIIEKAVRKIRRSAPVDLIAFAENSPERFIDDRGEIKIRFEALDWRRF